MLNFPDDVKLVGRVDLAEDVGQLKMDLKIFGTWAEKWQTMFNVEKCKVINIGL